MPFKVEIKPRFRDTDGLGHVNNAVFSTYLEVARSDWYLTIFSDSRPQDFNFILARIEINFKKPILLRSMVTVEMSIGRIGTSSWEFEYIMYDSISKDVYAEAKSVQVLYDYENHSKISLKEEHRNMLENL
ncbi:MAG: acyl-CoA thioesterase [Candidatus Heimdallarchaeota archaeon]|nr:acyl-CoA thioesterase [Candidatus Heimdallarchaeota archaeon]